MKWYLGTVMALGVWGGAASAAGVLYDCDMRDPERGRGWISPKIALVLPGDGSVRVVDAITLLFANGPTDGTLVRDDAARLIVKWSLPDVRADIGRSFAHFDYRASIAKGTGTLDLTGGPRGDEQGLRGSGTCRLHRE